MVSNNHLVPGTRTSTKPYALKATNACKMKVAFLSSVDDLIISGKSAEVTQTKDFLKSRYTMKDLEFVNHILGCEVFQDPSSKTLYMTQRRYILATLKRFLKIKPNSKRSV